MLFLSAAFLPPTVAKADPSGRASPTDRSPSPAGVAGVAAEPDRAAVIMRRIVDPDAGPVVVAHRGCHAPAATMQVGSAAENSLTALEHCVAMRVDVMETDIRMTRDGHLVMIHDATVDRTTDGHGRVADLTLAELRALRLRDDLGGAEAGWTEDRIVTLDEMLGAAAGRIVLNLDIKDAVHAETIAAVVAAGAEKRVLVKANAGVGSPPLASLPPFDRVPFLPMLLGGGDLPVTIGRQAGGVVRPIGYEVPRMPLAELPALVAAARRARGRVWANTLWDGYVAGVGGDGDALLDPERVWGTLIRGGVSMIQTDHPAELRSFIDRASSGEGRGTARP